MEKFLHLLCGTTILGIVIAEFFYMARSFVRQNNLLLHYTLQASYFGDGLIALFIGLQFFTAGQLVKNSHLSIEVPWVFIAYIAFSLFALAWLIKLILKRFYFTDNFISQSAIVIYYFLNSVMIMLFLLIIHDAILQQTWFDFLF